MTGAIPTYLVPLRNRYGIIGPIPPERLEQGSDQDGDQGQPARHEGHRARAPSTRSSRTRPTTGSATTRGASRSCSTRASTGSTSTRRGTRTRASIRSIATATRCTAIRRITRGRRCSRRTRRTSCWPRSRRLRSCTSATAAAPIPHARFNESFMMHASTSPLYPIIVSNDITAAMMDGPGGARSPTSRSKRPSRSARPWAACTAQFAQKRRLVLQDLERGHRQGSEDRQEDPLRGRISRAARDRSRLLGAASGRDVARLRRTSKTTTACSTRSRCRSSRRASPTRAASTSAAFRPAS